MLHLEASITERTHRGWGRWLGRRRGHRRPRPCRRCALGSGAAQARVGVPVLTIALARHPRRSRVALVGARRREVAGGAILPLLRPVGVRGCELRAAGRLGAQRVARAEVGGVLGLDLHVDAQAPVGAGPCRQALSAKAEGHCAQHVQQHAGGDRHQRPGPSGQASGERCRGSIKAPDRGLLSTVAPTTCDPSSCAAARHPTCTERHHSVLGI
jgi:hypothetical protein